MTILVVKLKKTGETIMTFMGKNYSHTCEKAYDAGYGSNLYTWECK